MKNSEKIIEEDKEAKQRNIFAKCVGGIAILGIAIAGLGGYSIGYNDGMALGHAEGRVQMANEFFRLFPNLKNREVYPTEF